MTKKVQNVAVKGLAFDVTGITAKEMAEINQAFRQTKIRAAAAVMANYVTACPDGWGPMADGSTYSRLPWLVFREVRDTFFAEVSGLSVEAEELAGLDFEMENMLAEDAEDALQANRDYDIEKLAEFMAKYAISCPWGPYDDPETYTELRQARFKAALDLFFERAADLTKN